jgi:type VI secretion system protein ImpL
LAGLTIALAAAWTTSYLGNRSLVAASEARVAAASRERAALPELRPGDETRLLALLNTLRDLPRIEAGGFVQLGLYQGATLRAQAERAYRNTLRESLLAHLALSLESALRSRPSRDLLDAYIGLYGTPDAQRLEQAALQAWRLPEAARADLASHLRAALAERPLALPRPRDDGLIEQTRRKLGAQA